MLLEFLAAVLDFRLQFGRNCPSSGTARIHNRVSSLIFLAQHVSLVFAICDTMAF
jgi:hypothetical protein